MIHFKISHQHTKLQLKWSKQFLICRCSCQCILLLRNTWLSTNFFLKMKILSLNVMLIWSNLIGCWARSGLCIISYQEESSSSSSSFSRYSLALIFRGMISVNRMHYTIVIKVVWDIISKYFHRFRKAPAGFELTNCRFIVSSLNHCAMLLGNNFGKEFFF